MKGRLGGVGGLEAKGAEQHWVVGADFVNSRCGGVVGRVVMVAEYCWIVGGGSSRLRCVRARERARPSPRCHQKRLFPLEGATLGGGGSKKPGLRIAIPPPCFASGVFGGR